MKVPRLVFVFVTLALLLSPLPATNDVQLSASPMSEPAPTLTAVSPTEAYNYKPTTITITGTGFFVPTGSPAFVPRVTLNNVPLPNVTFLSSTTLTATVPADLPGSAYTMTVTNPDNQSTNLANAFTVLHSGDGTLGVWQNTTPMPTIRDWPATVVAGRYLYVIGGGNPNWWDPNNVLKSVERTMINADGSLGPWQTMTSMTTRRAAFAAVQYGDYIYALGGHSGGGSSVERAVINADGSLGPWQATTSMTMGRNGVAAVATNGYLYAIGGGNDFTASVERAAINADGSLSPWQAVASMTTVRGYLAAVVVGDYLYAIGGQNPGNVSLSGVERATINIDGSLGPWEAVASMTTPRCDLAAVAVGGYIYAIGGSTCQDLVYDSVERAKVNTDGSLGPWQTMTSMTTPRYHVAAAQDGRYIYALGGMDNRHYRK